MALAWSDYLFDTSTSMGEAVSTSAGVLMLTGGLRPWIKLFRDADVQPNSITIPLYTPITEPRCNVKLHRGSIPYMGHLIAAVARKGGGTRVGGRERERDRKRDLGLLDSLRPLMIYQAR